jgi:dolichyl-phosphate-mannose-protein mannosyltransferase
VSSNASVFSLSAIRQEPARVLIPVITVMAVLRYWILPLKNSFWLDESIIVMISKNPLATVGMVAHQANQPILFGYIEHVLGSLMGSGEIAMRIPSLLAAFGSIYVLYSIGKEFVDRETGFIYALLFIFLSQTTIEVTNARPYALGLFCLLLSIRSLLRWMRDKNFPHATSFALYTALSAYLHPFFLIALPFEVAYAARKFRDADRRLIRQAAWTSVIGFVLLLPLIIPMELIISRREIIKFPSPPYVLAFIKDLVPFAVIAGCLLAWRITRSTKSFRLASREQLLLGALLMMPIPFLFAVAKVAGLTVFVDRYLLCAAPGIILFWGSLIRSIEPESVRRFALSGALILAFVTLQPVTRAVPDFREEDWRSALETAPHSGQMLIYTGLAETRKLDWLQQSSHWGYMVSPVGVYVRDVSLDRHFLIPFEYDAASQDYMDALLTQALTADTVTVVARDVFWAGQWFDWMADRLERRGYSTTRRESYGIVELRVFERPASSRTW